MPSQPPRSAFKPYRMQSTRIVTPRITQHVLLGGQADKPAILFIHGNASSSIFWKKIIAALEDDYFCIAPDLRGYGGTDDLTIDATRGFGDFVDDLMALLNQLGVDRCHVVGHSLGGGVIWSLLAAASVRFYSATLVNPASPFGFGGTKDVDGNPCFADFAGSGGGIVNPNFAQKIAEGDRSSDDPQSSPRVVMNAFYWKPPFEPDWIEDLLDGLLTEKIGPDRYPGDFEASANYPFVAPGKLGPINASSPKYLGNTVSDFIQNSVAVPIWWVRGDSDLIVSDQSFFDFGTLGKLGYIPNYPGEEAYPPQPMVSQTRSVLDQRAALGGQYTETVMTDCGHSPFIEQEAEFLQQFRQFLKGR